MMSNLKNTDNIKKLPSLYSQPCVKAIQKSRIPLDLKKELNSFISRNIIQDCKRVSPNCLKAHMIKTAQNLHLPKHKINKLKKIFTANIGYKGYYLDAGKLKKVND